MGDETSLFKATTAYNSISIETSEDYWTLRTANNDIQSRINRKYPQRLALKNLLYLTGVLLFIPPPKTVCLLGTAGGGLVHFLKHHYSDCDITAVDVDGEMLDILKQHMALPAPDDQLTYVVDDALHFLDRCDQQFDLILVDLFLGNKPPHWLLQRHSMEHINAQLTSQGGVGYNLIIDNERGFTQFYKNLRSVFRQQTLCLRVEDLDNILAFAFRNPPPANNMQQNITTATQLGEKLEINYMEILSAIYDTNPTGAGVI